MLELAKEVVKETLEVTIKIISRRKRKNKIILMEMMVLIIVVQIARLV